MTCRLSVYAWHPVCERKPRYTDGAEVSEGDLIRYRQAPGGLLPPSPEWKYGRAVVSRHCSEGLDMESPSGRRYNLLGHIIEKVEVES